jgi:4-amino-4-deoxy-L-arabinose transferase-like glycosyltransferase
MGSVTLAMGRTGGRKATRRAILGERAGRPGRRPGRASARAPLGSRAVNGGRAGTDGRGAALGTAGRRPVRERPSNAVLALLVLVAAGIALRALTIVSWWPTTTTLDDGYQLYARSNPFADPQHPAGYGLLVAALGAVSREVALGVLLQHGAGLASAGLLWAATRRVTGSAWAGLLPAAVVLLNGDEVFLEHAIMSESWAVLLTSAGLYASVRAFDEPTPAWRWPAAAGTALGVAVTVRTAGLILVAVAGLALLLARPRARAAWRAPAALVGSAAVVLVAFACANAAFGQGFGLGPSGGWYLYGRVAQFADCRRFTPPPGTRVLCDARPSGQRPGASYWLFDPAAPAPRHIGAFGERDALVGAWSRRALRAQPGDFATLAWAYLRAYWVPGARPDRPQSGVGLDPQLDFTFANPFFAGEIERNLEAYYDPFTVHPRRRGLEALHDWQRAFRFGGTALSIATVLVLAGLAVGTRRSRCGVLLLGVGGLSLLFAPAIVGNYVGRYTVPMAGAMAAGAAVALVELWRALRARRAAG